MFPVAYAVLTGPHPTPTSDTRTTSLCSFIQHTDKDWNRQTLWLNIALLSSVTRVGGRSCGSGSTWWCLVLLSRLLDPLTLHIICIRHSVNVTCKLWFFALFCTPDINCMSVHPGRGIPPLWLFLRFLPLFFFTLLKGSFFQVFFTRIEGLRTEDVVHCTKCKAHWGNVIYIVKLWTPDTESILQNCFAWTDWDVFKAAATLEDSSVSIQDYAEYVTGYISTWVDNIGPTIQIKKFPY